MVEVQEELLPEKDTHLDTILKAMKESLFQIQEQRRRMELENDWKLKPDLHHCTKLLSHLDTLKAQCQLLEAWVNSYYKKSEEE